MNASHIQITEGVDYVHVDGNTFDAPSGASVLFKDGVSRSSFSRNNVAAQHVFFTEGVVDAVVDGNNFTTAACSSTDCGSRADTGAVAVWSGLVFLAQSVGG